MNKASLSADHNSINNQLSADTQIQHAIACIFSSDKARNEAFFKNNVLKLPEAKVIFLENDYDRLIPSFVWDSHSHHNASAGYIEKDGLWGFIDQDGNEITPPRYTERPFYHITADVQDAATGKYGTVDIKGQTYNECKYEYITNSDYNVAKLDGKRGIVGAHDKELLPFIYDDIYITQAHEEHKDELAIALVREGNNIYCIDAITKQPIAVPEKRKTHERQFKGADKKYGFISKQGYIIPAEFDELYTSAKENKYLVYQNDLRKRLTLDAMGNMHLDILDDAMQASCHERYHHKQESTSSILDEKNDSTIEWSMPQDHAAELENYRGIKTDDKRSIVNEGTNEIILPAKFDEIHLHYGSRKAWGWIKQWNALVEVSLPKKAMP